MCEDHYLPNEFNYIEYMASSGGLSCPESDQRMDYYNMGGIPDLRFDGNWHIQVGAGGGDVEFIPFARVYGEGFQDPQRRVPDVARLEEALRPIDRLDILVNNAGLERPTPLTGTHPDGHAVFEKIISINVTGTQNVTDTLVNRIVDGGRIIITASIWAKTAVGGFSAYVASKHANVGLMRTWAKELGPRGICVNAVCPGWVRTAPAMKSLRALSEASGQSEEALLEDITGAAVRMPMKAPTRFTSSVRRKSSVLQSSTPSRCITPASPPPPR